MINWEQKLLTKTFFLYIYLKEKKHKEKSNRVTYFFQSLWGNNNAFIYFNKIAYVTLLFVNNYDSTF